ncbi:TnsA endonuclease N-terminal domain-containing protein [Radiobacillus sp. PE A8.2]|uniref:TnsA endonuclease N-terminal domain-containing protein n=1 Tax=Radiobacillus sp. PE A8.2 TaxID=3380349 RepID=UPI00388D4F38
MPKRKLEWTEKKIAKYIKEGRGSGEFSSYHPWLTIQDVRSDGRSHRIKGNKTNRVHHFFSDLERNYFYLLEWADDVIDIREQFPLEREETYAIAEEKGIKHPVDPKTGTPIVLTTDFMVTRKIDGNIEYVARTVKPNQLLNDERTIEKFEIEREYWERKGIDWGIVTEKEMPIEFIKNIMWVHSASTLENEEEEYLVDVMLELLRTHDQSTSMAEFAKVFEEEYHLNKGMALYFFKHLFSKKVLSFDMYHKFNLQKPLSEFSLRERGVVTEHDIAVG